MTILLRIRRSILLPASTLVAAIFLNCGTCIADLHADRFNALYVPPHKITARTFDEIVHYAGLTPINAVVLHVKTPRGKLLWPSDNMIARQLKVSAKHSGLVRHLARLKKDRLHTIAKLDIFADHQLASGMPELSVLDASTGLPWKDANGLHWVNPYDSRVWDYNIDLAKELASMGFDEIQFDYVRFPSDGDLSKIRYPNAGPDFSKSDTIQAFLERARSALAPFDVLISADIFGLTAWKTDDFGVGQVLEKMAPYLDVVCPMFYPSHFPAGFLGKRTPGDFPEMIMETSMRSMQRRTSKPIRPWIQGFWYRSDQVCEQLNGIEKAGGGSWSIWNPTGRYGVSYRAMADHIGTTLQKPQFYPTVTELMRKPDRSVRGNSTVVNYTNFLMGYSILSLEAPQNGKKSRYATPSAMIGTLEEGIVDHILISREIGFSVNTEPTIKRKLLSDLLLGDLGKDARRMRPEPIYIDWGADCRFSSRNIPSSRMEKYTQAMRRMVDHPMDDTIAENTDSISMAAVTENLFDVPGTKAFDPSPSPATDYPPIRFGRP